MPKMIYTEGKIVKHSWGYDQTNVDFYLITKRTAAFATLQPIGRTYEETGFLSGYSDPAQTRIDEHLDNQDAAASRRPVDVDLAEIFGADVAAMLEADYQRRLAAVDALIERNRLAHEEWRQRMKADEEWMRAAGFWPDWPEDENEVTQ